MILKTNHELEINEKKTQFFINIHVTYFSTALQLVQALLLCEDVDTSKN
jgi:hypothetical protein